MKTIVSDRLRNANPIANEELIEELVDEIFAEGNVESDKEIFRRAPFALLRIYENDLRWNERELAKVRIAISKCQKEKLV